ncbi:hypothetical protein, partial [Escherichia coli]|uniref:hypothetical protein n=1 Tax=Escherichia coli TaxID=562 RepID=UPI003B01F2D5
ITIVINSPLSIFWHVSCFIYCVSNEISRDATGLHHHKSAVAPKECILRILLRNGAVHLAKTNNKTSISLHLAKLNVT